MMGPDYFLDSLTVATSVRAPHALCIGIGIEILVEFENS